MLENQFSFLGIEIGWGDLPGQGRLEQLFLAVVANTLGFEISPETTDPHHTRQAFQINGAGRTGIDIPFPLLDLVFQACLTFVELLEVRQPLHLAMGNLVEGVLHPSGEARINEIGEMLFQQGGHSESREARGEGIALQGGVPTVHDRADDAGVGGGPADPLLLQHLHQRCFAEASWRLRLVPQCLHLLGVGRITGFQHGKQHLLALESCIGIVAALHVGPEESGKIDSLAVGTEARIRHPQINRHHREPGLGHLTGNGALPDQLVQRQIPAIKACLRRSSETFSSRTDRLVGLLGIA